MQRCSYCPSVPSVLQTESARVSISLSLLYLMVTEKYWKHLRTRSSRCKHQSHSNQTSKISNKTEISQNTHCNRQDLPRTSCLYRAEEEDSYTRVACSRCFSWCCQLCSSQQQLQNIKFLCTCCHFILCGSRLTLDRHSPKWEKSISIPKQPELLEQKAIKFCPMLCDVAGVSRGHQGQKLDIWLQ